MSARSNTLSLCNNGRDGFAVDYDLRDKLGEGTFSVVWLCVRRSDGVALAAKILRERYDRIMDAAAWNAISEVTVAASVGKHPFLLTMERAYHDAGSGEVVLVTELMANSLHDVIKGRRRPLDDARIKSYMYQMLEGLKYMHENGFVHRDVKPENILLKCGDKLLKIGDFGTACRVSGGGGGGGGCGGQPHAQYVATRWYRPPECVLTRGWYGTKFDVWAAGCVLYEMATLRPLFGGNDENELMATIDRVLGPPDRRLIDRFRKHKSDVLVALYETGGPGRRAAAGVGLRAVYQPCRPAYELLKDMVVYDPFRRLSADRLLRKPYFHEMRNTRYGHMVNEFVTRGGNATRQTPTTTGANHLPPTTTGGKKRRGPGGDRASQPLANATLPVGGGTTERRRPVADRTTDTKTNAAAGGGGGLLPHEKRPTFKRIG